MIILPLFSVATFSTLLTSPPLCLEKIWNFFLFSLAPEPGAFPFPVLPVSCCQKKKESTSVHQKIVFSY
ncbi:hypothetical protein BT93_L1751 [Corymbia citriodora subsp. variegata]|uniref:Secreted protein n=1 Tax=Corymbia citriodora subsp. variegata TaxID=360336 RepID=A0A8T0CM67_CORYI|nr:hypothetical protein BT93_L1751 [Corymbia citriodora subsp. variegata]